MTRKELEKAVASKADLRNLDLSGLDLEGIDLSGWKDLSGVNFSKANLKGADLCNAILKDANFKGANLERAKLLYTELAGADFTGANLKNANLWSSKPSYANFTKADLRNATFQECEFKQTNLRNAKIDGADFFYSKFAEAKCYGLNFKDLHVFDDETGTFVVHFDGVKVLDPKWIKNLKCYDKYAVEKQFKLKREGSKDEKTGKPIYVVYKDNRIAMMSRDEEELRDLIADLEKHIENDEAEAYTETHKEVLLKVQDIEADDEEAYLTDYTPETYLATIGLSIPEWPGGFPEDLELYEELKLHEEKYNFKLLPIHREYYSMNCYHPDAPFIDKAMDSPAFSYKLCPPDTELKYKEIEQVNKFVMPEGFPGIHPIINKKIYEVLSSLNIPTVQLLKSSISINEVEYKDYWTLNIHTFIEGIDFKHTNGIQDGYDDLVSDTQDGTTIRLVVDAAKLSAIPLEERLIFRFKEAKSIVIFHQSIVDKINAIKPKQIDFTSILEYYGNE